MVPSTVALVHAASTSGRLPLARRVTPLASTKEVTDTTRTTTLPRVSFLFWGEVPDALGSVSQPVSVL